MQLRNGLTKGCKGDFYWQSKFLGFKDRLLSRTTSVYGVGGGQVYNFQSADLQMKGYKENILTICFRRRLLYETENLTSIDDNLIGTDQ